MGVNIFPENRKFIKTIPIFLKNPKGFYRFLKFFYKSKLKSHELLKVNHSKKPARKIFTGNSKLDGSKDFSGRFLR